MKTGLLSPPLELLLRECRFPGVEKLSTFFESLTGVMPLAHTTDPRDDVVVIFSPKRNIRPHTSSGLIEKRSNSSLCKICAGETTPIILKEPISDQHYAFVNENLYPFLNPFGTVDELENFKRIRGMHFLLWPTTEHKDIHELSSDEHLASYLLMSRLEQYFLQSSGVRDWHMQVFKNTGKSVGGSLDHGHYQIGFLNHFPKKIREDHHFLEKYGVSFVEFLVRKHEELKEQGIDLAIKSYPSVIAVVPYFMRRPFDAFILPRDPSLHALAYLTSEEQRDFAQATSDLTRALSLIMPMQNKEFAYNLLFHAGPIGTLYLEILPFTQYDGGFEKAGVMVCQSTPEESAQEYRKFLGVQDRK